MTHIDDFIDNVLLNDPATVYARWFFVLYRFPAVLKMQFSKWTRQYQLFCTFEGHRYRVTGCSRMGDVWLHSDYSRDCGYEERVAVDECSDWGEKP